MKRLFCIVFVSLCAAIFWSCTTEYEYYTQSLNRFTIKEVNLPALDSIILYQDSLQVPHPWESGVVYSEQLSHEHRFKDYTPKDKLLASKSDSAAASMVMFSLGIAKFPNPITLKAHFEIKVTNSNYWETTQPYWSTARVIDFYLDIFGCEDFSCETAEKIVLRSGDYSQVLVIEPEDFTFTEIKFVQFYNGDCSEYTKKHAFNLKIKNKHITLDTDIQLGHINCREVIPNAMFAAIEEEP